MNQMLQESVTSYNLHEFDPDKVFSGRIDINAVNSEKYTSYSFNEAGTLILDKNSDFSTSRKLISLSTSKVSQSKFNQIIDIEFKEFVEEIIDPTIALRNNIDLLNEQLAVLLAEQDVNQDTINSLNNEIETLRVQLNIVQNNIVPENEVPDTLTANSVLFSDRTGALGAPGYPVVQDRLLSKNRKAIAKIDQNGVLYIWLGTFDSRGQSIPGTPMTRLNTFGRNLVPAGQPTLAALALKVYGGSLPSSESELAVVQTMPTSTSDIGNQEAAVFGNTSPTDNAANPRSGAIRVGAGRTRNQPQPGQGTTTTTTTTTENVTTVDPGEWITTFSTGKQNLSLSSRLVLDDNGYLTLYDNLMPKWSSFGK